MWIIAVFTLNLSFSSAISCIGDFSNIYNRGMDFIGQILDEVNRQHQVPELDVLADSASLTFAPACSAFITEDSMYGPFGQIMHKELDEEHLSYFFSNDLLKVNNFSEVCPNFKNLNREQRKRFWIWTFMSIAMVESSCDPTRVGDPETSPTKTPPLGLLQMEGRNRGLDGTRSVWAENPQPRLACASNNLLDVETNIRCGLDAMLVSLKGYHTPGCVEQHRRGAPPLLKETCVPNFFNNKWEGMRCRLNRPRGCNRILNKISTFKLCEER